MTACTCGRAMSSSRRLRGNTQYWRTHTSGRSIFTTLPFEGWKYNL